MKYQYRTQKTCCQLIEIEIDSDIIKSVQFYGGCMGNHQGISKLVENMKINDVISKLSGIDCGGRGTSCPDQLSKALTEIQKQQNLISCN